MTVDGGAGPRDRWTAWIDSTPAPLVVAPMTVVSTPELAAAACAAGVIGSFPTHNARSAEELDQWLEGTAALTADWTPTGAQAGPLAVNVMLRRPAERVEADLVAIADHGVPIVIASVGSPRPIVAPLHEAGAMVLADVATMRHVASALDAGVDGLVLLTAGAGGQTGWLNGMSFIRAVRDVYDGPVVLAGGISDGTALWAAEVLGYSAGYMGTPFIATLESGGEEHYREALVTASMDDVELTTQASGINANFLKSWPDRPPARHGYSAGHTVSAIAGVVPSRELIARTCDEYRRAQVTTARRLKGLDGP